ncbi:hypothetical protein L873DRAFT_1643819, partial [Choiromyces venosus 120613-1]
LIRQVAYRADMVYAPVCEYDSSGDQLYSEMHTADWWWEVQQALPTGSTVVPIIRLSDQTHLTNFLGDKKAWPVYVTIGNILSRTRNSPTKMPILLLALLPVPPKFTRESACADKLQRQINADALRAVFDLALAPLVKIAQDGVVMDCAHGKRRLCYPILSAWIADHTEHTVLHGITNKSCPNCEV